MTQFFIVPGLGDSGPEHWQSFFEKSSPYFQRIRQKDWDAPLCDDWIKTMDDIISQHDPSTVVLIGHSLGCLAIVHWAKKYNRKIKGALLVAPSDAEAGVYTFPAKGFSPIPLDQLAFKSIVVASNDDIWVSAERAKLFAESWGSELITIGNAGHINVASGHTNWEEGLAILKKLDS